MLYRFALKTLKASLLLFLLFFWMIVYVKNPIYYILKNLRTVYLDTQPLINECMTSLFHDINKSSILQFRNTGCYLNHETRPRGPILPRSFGESRKNILVSDKTG